MKECQSYIHLNIQTVVMQVDELESHRAITRYFVTPTLRDDVIRKIREHVEKPIIYTPRAIIEARGYLKVALPVRNLAISLSMFKCQIFLVKSCNIARLKNKIHEMCGTVVTNFSDSKQKANVVVTDMADNKYCSRAYKLGIPCVSKDWIESNYSIACLNDPSVFNHDALSTIPEHQIKPFHGLHFKISLPHQNTQILKKLIIENQGKIVYGNENSHTHIVSKECKDTSHTSHDDSGQMKDNQEPRVVSSNFLEVCAQQGYYLSKKDYREHLETMHVVIVKEERRSPDISQQHHHDRNHYHQQQELYYHQQQLLQTARSEEGFTPPNLPIKAQFTAPTFPVVDCNNSTENQSMPPPLVPSQQPDRVSDMIRKALSSFENGAPTQLASTQMRRLPERELVLEQTFEPSQQLYWSDSVTRRH